MKLYTVPLTEILRGVLSCSPPSSTEHLRIYFDIEGHNEMKLEKFVLPPPTLNELEDRISDD